MDNTDGISPEERVKAIYMRETLKTRESVQAVMATRDGRRVMMRVLSLTGFFDRAGYDHAEYNAGKRDIGANLWSILYEASPDELFKARQESDEDLAKVRRDIANARAQGVHPFDGGGKTA